MNILRTIIQGFGEPYLVCATYENSTVLNLRVYPIYDDELIRQPIDCDMSEFHELKDSLEEFLATLQPEEA
jgi:hypothetical protein